MKRPSDQAKLLFFYLLRSSAAAMATTSKDVLAGHICLRLARRTDVPSIQRCNLATLPENYNSEFYAHHLRTWPDLALVAEHVPPTQQSVHRSFPGSQPEPSIVGYVLGKVEDRCIPYDPKTGPLDSKTKTFKDLAGNTVKLEPTGHVTSLAVHHDFRRRGLAASLMNQLHLHLEHAHGVSHVGLHVRQGNVAATKLYEGYGYNVDEVLQHYYADGEPAYLMRKSLQSTTTAKGTEEKTRFRMGRSGVSPALKPWQGRASFDLPRIIWRPEQEQVATVTETGVPVEVMTST